MAHVHCDLLTIQENSSLQEREQHLLDGDPKWILHDV